MLTPTSFLQMREDFHQEDGHSSDLRQKKVVFYSCYQTTRRLKQSRCFDDDQIRRQRIHSSEERSKAKEVDNYQYTSARMEIRLKLFFAQLFLLSIYGAVSDLCDEHRICQARTERLVLAEQSDPLFEPASLLMTIPTPSTEDPAQEDLLQKYQERVERLSQQNRVVKICTDAGFLTTVDVGQYFMTKDSEEFSQFTEPVTCREYTLPRDEKSSDPKGWIRGNTNIGPC